MSASHGNTPAAWTGVTVAMVGIVVGCIALLLDPISFPVLYVGLGIMVAGWLAFIVMDKLGLHE